VRHEIASGHDGDDAGLPEGGSRVDAANARVRVRATDEDDVREPGHCDVRDVLRRARDQARILFALDLGAQKLGCHDVLLARSGRAARPGPRSYGTVVTGARRDSQDVIYRTTHRKTWLGGLAPEVVCRRRRADGLWLGFPGYHSPGRDV